MKVFRAPVTASERAGATESNCTRIAAIEIHSSLGYLGCGREEHSGENSPIEPDDLLDHLADNRARQLGRTGGH
jgi:hypothetical protein